MASVTKDKLTWIYTNYGLRRITEVMANPDDKLAITKLVVGDSETMTYDEETGLPIYHYDYYTPDPTQVDLKHPVDSFFFHGKELDLDKDIKQSNIPINNKVYSLETCQFISKHINRAIVTRKKSPNIKIISQKGDYVLETDCPVNELANKLNIKTQYITRILRGEAKTHNGWTFKYG